MNHSKQPLYPEQTPVLMKDTFNKSNSFDSAENLVNMIVTSRGKSQEMHELTKNQIQCPDDVDFEGIKEKNINLDGTWENTHMTRAV